MPSMPARQPAAASRAAAQQWIGREQARLDAIWQELIGLTEGNVNAELVAEQKAWEAFRDASCAFKLDDGLR